MMLWKLKARGGYKGKLDLPVVLVSPLYWEISKIYVSKKNKGINVDINATLEVKRMIEEEIEKLNERKNVPSDKNIIISVRERQKEIEDEAKENYNNKNKIKRLTLRKRK